ncbi:unnamed protein product [Sphagnum troendelagicum]|uniref:ZP domain-containing protein n=1 Tax=Sphagnum troendelagicum TaxID=128251 RepID=A0ABP0U273_9BRYO
MTTFLAVVGVNRRLSSLMQLLLPLFFITLMTCTLAFSGGVQSSQKGFNTTGSCITQPALQQALTVLFWIDDLVHVCMHVFPTADCSGIAEQGANFTAPLMSGEIQLNGQAATVLQHRQKNKYTYRRQLSEFNGTCTKLDISLVQGQEGTTGGIPTRLSLNDCLVNNGNPISDGDMIRFEYDNSFMYPMHVQSAVTCHWTS